MLWVQQDGSRSAVEGVAMHPQVDAQALSPLMQHNPHVIPFIHTPTTSTRFFLQ